MASPSPTGRENTQAGQYPLSRPLFIYVAVDALEDDRVSDFAADYLEGVEQMLPRVFYFPLPHEAYELVATRLHDRTTGTIFEDGATGEEDVMELLRAGQS